MWKRLAVVQWLLRFYLVECLVNVVLQMLSEPVIHINQLLHIAEDHGQLLGCEQSCTLHGEVELFLDDAQILAVTRLCVEELQNGLLSLGP